MLAGDNVFVMLANKLLILDGILFFLSSMATIASAIGSARRALFFKQKSSNALLYPSLPL